MCFGGSSTVSNLPQAATLPTPVPPKPPPSPQAASQSLIPREAEPAVRTKGNQRQRLAMQRGTSQLRIPLNQSQSSGGLNT